jgi:hypothetical protein
MGRSEHTSTGLYINATSSLLLDLILLEHDQFENSFFADYEEILSIQKKADDGVAGVDELSLDQQEPSFVVVFQCRDLAPAFGHLCEADLRLTL